MRCGDCGAIWVDPMALAANDSDCLKCGGSVWVVTADEEPQADAPPLDIAA